FSSQAHFCVCLCSWLDRVDDISVHRLDTHIPAKGCLCKRDRGCGKDIHILSLENRMSGDSYFHKKISSWPSVCSRFAFVANAHTLPVVNTCRDRYLDRLLVRHISGAAA